MFKRSCVSMVVLTFCVLTSGVAGEERRPDGAGDRLADRGVMNWPAPLFWSAAKAERATAGDDRRARAEANGKAAAVSLSTSPLPLIGITPCRLVDTRDASMPPGYGPPELSAGVPRSFTLAGECGIANGAQAVSLNITVVSPTGIGYVLIYPQGSAQPVVSTLNYTAGETLANAAIVPLGNGGGITVASAIADTELLIDVNGYFAAAGVGADNTFLGINSGNFTMTGEGNSAYGRNTLANNTSGFENTASGASALYSNTIGAANTANGATALYSNTTGEWNTASGDGALYGNTIGIGNAALGYQTLFSNTEGNYNTATGSFALASNTTGSQNVASGLNALNHNTTGANNTALGWDALFLNTTAGSNTAVGDSALIVNTTGFGNTALGEGALGGNVTGSTNIGVGFQAGVLNLSGDSNIYIGNGGADIESLTIRIGDTIHARAFLAAVRGVGTTLNDAIPVVIDSAGQLGTSSSSRRFKEGIADMADASSGLMKLRPVSFCYKGQSGERRQFGLIAEEVEDVLPDLVVHDAAGNVETVLYQEMPAMLLNELQKQQRTIEAQARALERQDEAMASLRERLAALEAEKR